MRDPEPSYRAWKVDAVKALQRLNARAAFATPERLWTQFYIRRFSLAEAAELAEAMRTMLLKSRHGCWCDSGDARLCLCLAAGRLRIHRCD